MIIAWICARRGASVQVVLFLVRDPCSVPHVVRSTFGVGDTCLRLILGWKPRRTVTHDL